MFGFSALSTIQMRLVSEEARGRYFALTQALENGTLALSVIAGGVLLDMHGVRPVAIAVATIHMISGFCYLVLNWLAAKKRVIQ